jgi:hypothetical protein
VLQLLVTANFVPSSLILVTLTMEVLHSSKTSVLTTATWHNIPEDGILHSHYHEILRSYKDIGIQLSTQQAFHNVGFKGNGNVEDLH